MLGGGPRTKGTPGGMVSEPVKREERGREVPREDTEGNSGITDPTSADPGAMFCTADRPGFRQNYWRRRAST